jgi:hypothetical protein
MPKIYCEKASGAQPERRELLRLLKAVAQATLPVRYRQTDCGRRRAIPLTGRALGRHLHKHRSVMIAVLGGLADVERDLIRTRRAEGRTRAKARGQRMGRPPKLTPEQQREARLRRAAGATLEELAKSYNVARATISRLGA